jgi:hypothetical protein
MTFGEQRLHEVRVGGIILYEQNVELVDAQQRLTIA